MSAADTLAALADGLITNAEAVEQTMTDSLDALRERAEAEEAQRETARPRCQDHRRAA